MVARPLACLAALLPVLATLPPLAARAAPAAAPPVATAPAPPPDLLPAAGIEGGWQVVPMGQTVPMPAKLGWAVPDWNTFVVVMLECDPAQRSVRISLDIPEEELAPVVTRQIRHGAGTLTFTGRPPTEEDGEGSYWLEAVRSYDEIAPALDNPAPWTVGPVVLADPNAGAAFRGFRILCGISGQ